MTFEMPPKQKISMSASLDAQRQALRQQLRQQRAVLALQLSPPEVHADYPRSKTMRFLMQRPSLVKSVLAMLMPFVLRARIFKSATTVMLLKSVVQAALAARQKP